MPSKNDISAFADIKNQDVLKQHIKQTREVRRKHIGRPTKSKADLENYRVNFNLTQVEGEQLAKLANIASVNVFVKHYLRNHTDLLE